MKSNDADRVGASIGVVGCVAHACDGINVVTDTFGLQARGTEKLLHRMSPVTPRVLWDALIGFLRLAIATRFRLRGAYWTWRSETAFGSDPTKQPGRMSMMRMAIEYAAWTTRMRRLR